MNLYSDAFVACRQGQWKGNNYSLVFSEEEGKKVHIVFLDVIFKCHCSLTCCFLVLPLEFLGSDDKMFAASRLARQQYLHHKFTEPALLSVHYIATLLSMVAD